MKKMYCMPEVECTPISSQDLMQTVNESVGGGINQNSFFVPSLPNEFNNN